MRVKICGIRSASDLAIATDAGVNAVGFLVGLTHKSEDKLDPIDARALVRQLRPFVQGILVTHLTEPREIVDLTGYVGLNAVQLHGEMTVEAVLAVRELLPLTTLIRAVHVTPGIQLAELEREVAKVARSVNAIILDSRTIDRLGGTGMTHDWSISRHIARASPVPVILAGGLTPDNVSDAVRVVCPYAVDTNSGVETKDGDKSSDLCDRFVANARF